MLHQNKLMKQLQLDSNPGIGAVSRIPLQALESTVGRFNSCFSFSLAKGNNDSGKRMRDSSSDAISVNFLHFYVNPTSNESSAKNPTMNYAPVRGEIV